MRLRFYTTTFVYQSHGVVVVTEMALSKFNRKNFLIKHLLLEEVEDEEVILHMYGGIRDKTSQTHVLLYRKRDTTN